MNQSESARERSNLSLDGGKPFDWGRTSSDYLTHRPGYPPSFFRALAGLGIPRRNQRILDLASGPGILAIPFALQGAAVTALDVAEDQIDAARKRARAEGVELEYMVADGLSSGLPTSSFDLVSASMCLHYFDREAIAAEIHRLLVPGGMFLAGVLLYLPRRSPIAEASERLILKHNPSWGSGDYTGDVAVEPPWAKSRFRLRSFHRYVEDIQFTRESWRGRIRACRGVGASLSKAEVQAFDLEHSAMLEEIAPPEFGVPHLIAFHVFEGETV